MVEKTPSNQPLTQRALDIKRRHKSHLRTYPNVSGIGVGYKIKGGKRTEEICLRVYVAKKLPREQLLPEEVIPENIDGVPTDVIQAVFEIYQDGSNPSIADHRRSHNPLIGGISVGNLSFGGSGTIGASVFDNRDGDDLILSNWHVLCCQVSCSAGETIIQPGQGGQDTGGPGDVVARLLRWARTDEIDAAVARLSGHRFLQKDLLGLGLVTDTADAYIGMRVAKSGRTTGVTVGTVGDISADVTGTGYSDGDHEFRNQIIVEGDDDLSAPGDSGSVWVDSSNKAVGLLFAGDSGLSVANPIKTVLQELDCNLSTGITSHGFVASITVLLL